MDFTLGMPVTLGNLDLQSDLIVTDEITGLGNTMAADSGTSPGRDGGWTTTGYRQPQRMELKGAIRGTDAAVVEQTWQALTQLGARTPVRLRLGFVGGYAYRWVQRTGEILVRHPLGMDRVEFSLPLVAHDPTWWTGDPATPDAFTLTLAASNPTGLTFPAQFPISFPGVADGSTRTITSQGKARLRAVINGACKNPRLTLQPDGLQQTALSWPITLAAGQQLTLDVDGTTYRAAITGAPVATFREGPWPAFPAGNIRIGFQAQITDSSNLPWTQVSWTTGRP